MNHDDLTIFDIPLARATDPETSQRGAADVRIRAMSQKHVLLGAYIAAGDEGLTDDQAGRYSRLSDNPRCGYWKRCSELRAVGLIERTGRVGMSDTGNDADICSITPAGIAACIAADDRSGDS
jgi:hypothetical protein